MLRSGDYENIRELADSSSNSTSDNDGLNWFSLTDERFTGLFMIMPIGVAAVAGAVAGAITNINNDTLNENTYLGPIKYITCSGDDAKTAINRLCRTITFMDVVGSSIGSIFYGSPNQITTVQHTVTAIWVWTTGVPAAFVAAENLMKPIYRPALANQ